ncbi:MAG TPA: LPS export ABC transporter ATP-binding protein [Gammaproteobacteria bacterium]|nr:LPS export ABC transporter ATP-binding protein [Gammaproteobacteria bacterium]
MNILKAEHLTKTYKQRQVVKDISIQVSSRQIVGLLGPNGAGKTTCFYMIIGLIPSDGGLVTLNRQNITALPLHARAQLGLGYLPQEASVFRKLTVEENILAILETRKKLTPQERTEKCEALIAEFQLSKVRDSMGISLSGGERRRTEIARALAMEPSFILLDEPFAGVDPISVIEIKKQVKHLASMGIGILITDHNVRETLDICDEATIVNEGRVIASGTPQTVLANQQVREVYLGEAFSL